MINALRRLFRRPPRFTPGRDGFFVAATACGPRRLYHSQFDIAWLATLGVVPKTVVDVGAYDAGDGVRLKLSFPGARVVAFEADPQLARAAAAYASGLGVELVNAAVGDHDGEVDWYAARDAAHSVDGVGSQGSTFRQTAALDARHPHVRQSPTPIRVRSCRLDSFCAGAGIARIDLAHIDVQGAEHRVLLGAGRLRPKVLFIEIQRDDAGWVGAAPMRDVVDLLSRMEYELVADLGSDRLYVHRARRGASGGFRARRRRPVATAGRHDVI